MGIENFSDSQIYKMRQMLYQEPLNPIPVYEFAEKQKGMPYIWTMKNSILIGLKGMAMGIAEVIPGVSGGTIAFITGIYENLISTIKAFGPEVFVALKNGGIAEAWRSINGPFLLALLAGMAVGIIVGVFGVVHLLENFPEILWAFFFGLIIASAVFIGRQVDGWKIQEIAFLAGGIAVAYFITVATPAEGNQQLWFVFLSGAIAICALILPGISGSFILLLLGMYTSIIPTLKDALRTFAPESLLIMGIFGAGCLTGLFAFSRVLSWMFKYHHNKTLAMLTGFMIGSLNKIWPWRVPVRGYNEEGEMVNWTPGTELDKILEETRLFPSEYADQVGDPQTMPAIIAIVAGFALVFIIERFGSDGGEKKKFA